MKWNPTIRPLERLVWVKCLGILVLVWSEDFFKVVLEDVGEFIRMDDDSKHMARLDFARCLVATSSMPQINLIQKVKIGDLIWAIRLLEETSLESRNSCKHEKWKKVETTSSTSNDLEDGEWCPECVNGGGEGDSLVGEDDEVDKGLSNSLKAETKFLGEVKRKGDGYLCQKEEMVMEKMYEDMEKEAATIFSKNPLNLLHVVDQSQPSGGSHVHNGSKPYLHLENSGLGPSSCFFGGKSNFVEADLGHPELSSSIGGEDSVMIKKFEELEERDRIGFNNSSNQGERQVRSDSERRGANGGSCKRDIRFSNEWIREMELVDLLLIGRNFTWYRYGSMSKLDRFLISPGCLLTWLDTSQWDMIRDFSNYCSIVLRQRKVDKDSFSGRKAFIIKEKLKGLKRKIKIWNKDSFGCLDKKLGDNDAWREDVRNWEIGWRRSLFGREESLAKNLYDLIKNHSCMRGSIDRWVLHGSSDYTVKSSYLAQLNHQQSPIEPMVRRLNGVLKQQMVDRSMRDPCVESLPDERSRRRVPLMKGQANGGASR
ncbi:hypothetical protein Lal_00002390 [Lupinus albus]|nr:hypothetical protein Lal_00002390 [Lupinus albus]